MRRAMPRNLTLIKTGKGYQVKPEHQEPGTVIAHVVDKELCFTKTYYYYQGLIIYRCTSWAGPENLEKNIETVNVSLTRYPNVCTGYIRHGALQKVLAALRRGDKGNAVSL